ncbi:hypothetical protein OHS70_08210 [Streptomyces sp. NBC_00390]|uniref:hypothetical protein n=1 Tax=Streptomyces sp. NBC_00390 TaxID=2975736 RepID=UPI002E1B8D54
MSVMPPTLRMPPWSDAASEADDKMAAMRRLDTAFGLNGTGGPAVLIAGTDTGTAVRAARPSPAVWAGRDNL